MILVSIVLVLAGQFALADFLGGSVLRFILYWGACGIFTMLALFTALVDMVSVRRDAARAERKLVQETFSTRPHRPENDKSGEPGGIGKE